MSELEELLFVPGEDFEAAILTLWAHVRELEKRLEDYDTQRIDKLAGRIVMLEQEVAALAARVQSLELTRDGEE